MPQNFIGRAAEQQLLESLYQSPDSDMVSITGRRRVGKTFLVRHTFADRIDFDVTGSQYGRTGEQLRNFAYSLSLAQGSRERLPTPEDWQSAFFALQDYLMSLGGKDRKKVVFIDEIPWLAASDPLFIRSFGHFWNSYAGWNNVLVIICGSAASWIVRKIVQDRGGLHNRITKRIFLKPYTLAETEQYLKHKHVILDRYSITQLYMVMGGIPFYLNEIKTGESVPQAIDRICFDERGLLNNEFKDLYLALFDDGKRHIQVVRALASSPYGLSRQQIIEKSGVSNGGSLSIVLEELEYCGFITKIRHFNKRNKGKIYRLLDEYSLFYLQFIEPVQSEGQSTWLNLSKQQAYTSWTGYAFENIGFTHLQQIKYALGIRGVTAATYSFQHKGTADTPGLQIDMVIERQDRVTNLCEFKFYSEPVSMDAKQSEALRLRALAFEKLAKSNSALFNTLIAPYGASMKTLARGVIQQVVTLEDLFREGF